MDSFALLLKTPKCMEKQLPTLVVSARPIPELPVGPAALLVLLAAAARAGRIRLGLLPPRRPGQCLARVVANDLVDSSQGLGCLGVHLANVSLQGDVVRDEPVKHEELEVKPWWWWWWGAPQPVLP